MTAIQLSDEGEKRTGLDAGYRRIERAFCVELGRVVTIDQARLAFAEGSDLSAFHFECAEAPCASRGIRIAGVNYHFDAVDRPKLVANHFRRLDDHAPDCIYFASGINQEYPQTKGSRKARALRTDVVETFVPPRQGSGPVPENVPLVSDDSQTKRPRRAVKNRRRATESLERLIESYRILVRSKIPNVLRSHQLRVRGQGVLPIGDYITPIYRARKRAFEHVVYGGARWVKSYGNGFKLRFIDRLIGEPVYIYVAPGLLGNRRPWIKELAHLCEGGYCTVYVLGDLQHGPERRAFSIDVASPEHLVIAMPSESMSRVESRESGEMAEASAPASGIAPDAPSRDW